MAAHRNKLVAEFWSGYRRHRKQGRCPCNSAWHAAYDWDF
jgi:hypothetical protein